MGNEREAEKKYKKEDQRKIRTKMSRIIGR